MSNDEKDSTTSATIQPITSRLFEGAVRANSRRLLAIARAIVGNRASPEDVVQQAVINLFQHRDRYDWREPGGLLRRAVVNEALRLLRQPRMSLVTDDHPAPRRRRRPERASMDERRRSRTSARRSPSSPSISGRPWCCASTSRCRTPRSPRSLGASVPQVKTWIHRADANWRRRSRISRNVIAFAGGQDRGRCLADKDIGTHMAEADSKIRRSWSSKRLELLSWTGTGRRIEERRCDSAWSQPSRRWPRLIDRFAPSRAVRSDGLESPASPDQAQSSG